MSHKATFIVIERLVACFLTFRSSDLITALTYVIMDKFCPCLNVYIHVNAKIKAWGEVLIEHQQRGWNHQIIQNNYLSAHYRNHVYKNPGNVWLDYGLPTLQVENKSVLFQYNCISQIKKVHRKKDALAGFNSYLNLKIIIKIGKVRNFVTNIIFCIIRLWE